MGDGLVLLADCLDHAGRRLGLLTRGGMRMRVRGGRLVALGRVAAELGDAEAAVAATVVAIAVDRSDLLGLRFVLAVDPAVLPLLATMAAGEEYAGDPAMAESVLLEMGNIGASAVANRIAHRIGATVRTSAPDLVRDRWGSVLAAVLGSFADPPESLPTASTELLAGERAFPGSACLVADHDAERIPDRKQRAEGG